MKCSYLFLLIGFINFPASSQLTENQRNEIVSSHNYARQKVKPLASDEENVVYNISLEQYAEEEANKCIFQRPEDDMGDYDTDNDVGYNSFLTVKDESTVEDVLGGAVMEWMGEGKYFSYEEGKCSQPCTFYKQLVWANSDNVGCAVNYCPNFEYYSLSFDATLVICAYGPKGNIPGEKPYEAQVEPTSTSAPSISGMTVTISNSELSPTPTPINNNVAMENDLDDVVPPRKPFPCPFPAGLSEILKSVPEGKTLFWERLFIADDGQLIEC